MPTGFRALIVILTVAFVVFRAGKGVCLRHMDNAAFCRRRNVWLALTILAFAVSSFWLYVAIAMPLMFFAARRDENPLALYAFLMFAVPDCAVELPTFGGIGQFFDLSHLRLLSMAILLPLLMRRRDPQKDAPRGLNIIDWILIAYCGLQLLLLMPYEAFTNTFRRALLLFLDTYVVYYAFARIRPTRKAVTEVLASFSITLCVVAILAVFETVRGWLLYDTIPTAWGAFGLGYLQRGESLRAQVTTGHSLGLGYVMSLAIGFWLFLQTQEVRSQRSKIINAVFWAGLFASYSRGAWLTGVLVLTIYLALRPGALGVIFKVLPYIVAACAAVYMSPLKEALIDRLPFIGSSDQDTVDYRRQLLEVSWQLIQVNPWFGDPFVTRNMEELRQGQGIIDIINAYIMVALFTGIVGLTLFSAFFLGTLLRCYTAMRAWLLVDKTTALLGVSLFACMLSTLFFMATAGVGPIQYVLSGLIVSYSAIAVGKRTAVEPSQAANTGLPAGKSKLLYE